MRTVARRLAEVFGTGFYSGYFPIAPGTVGSGVGVGIYLVLLKAGVLSPSSLAGWVSLAAIVLAAGWASAWHLERRFGHDDKHIVIDEIWGMLIAVALLPASARYVVGGFLLFRLFDIVKPFPARRVERIGSGLGVMLDDGIAGIYANLVLHLAKALVR
ncbi:MAG TPA: phosphatidylglycerophosphatase A [bacterium]|nr:phosphatidylglycerophosphatase A [bacterium]